MGNTGVHDDVLAAAAGCGNRGAFGLLFARHVDAVFVAAWELTRDRTLATEVTRDVFAAAWEAGGHVATERFADRLIESARDIASAWFAENPRAGPPAVPADHGEPTLSPVLRARIVAGLNVRGVPTKADPVAVAALRTPVWRRFGPIRLVAASVAAVVIVGGIVVVLGDDDNPEPIEAATRESTAAGATTPVVYSFTGQFRPTDRGKCGSGQELLTLEWHVGGGTTVWLYTDGGDWEGEHRLPYGTAQRCTASGTTWNLTIEDADHNRAGSSVKEHF